MTRASSIAKEAAQAASTAAHHVSLHSASFLDAAISPVSVFRVNCRHLFFAMPFWLMRERLLHQPCHFQAAINAGRAAEEANRSLLAAGAAAARKGQSSPLVLMVFLFVFTHLSLLLLVGAVSHHHQRKHVSIQLLTLPCCNLAGWEGAASWMENPSFGLDPDSWAKAVKLASSQITDISR